MRHRRVEAMVNRGALGIGVVVALATGAAGADTVKPSPTACVNREARAWRQVRDVALDTGSLRYCTGDDCWSFDLATRKVAAAPHRAPAPPPGPRDAENVVTDGQGAVLATARATHVEYCRANGSCTSFAYRVPFPVASAFPDVNAARTLGAVVVRGAGDLDPPGWILAFDLVAQKQVGKLEGTAILALDHGFLVGREVFYTAAFRKVGRIAAPDEGWIRIGSTDRIALRDRVKGDLILQSTTTGKAIRIPHGAADATTRFALAAPPDGSTLYAIGSTTNEGEVLVIDVGRAKIVERATPVVCAPGTRRVD